MTSMNGTIKRLVSDKGFGFIFADNGTEYFFHNSACQKLRSMISDKGSRSRSIWAGPERAEGRERPTRLDPSFARFSR